MSSRPARGAARLAAILDALPDALLLVNGNGTVVNANSIAMETLEAPGAPLIGRGLLDVIPEFDPRRIPGSMRRPDEDTGAQTKPTRMVARRTDGSELPVEVTSSSVKADQAVPYASAIEAAFADDHEELLMLVVRDLSGALDTEAELVRQQRQTEMILRAASEGVVGVDTAGRVVLVNPAAAQMLGHRASALGGQELHPLVHHSRPDGSPLPYEETPLHDTLTSGRKHRVRGQVLWTKDGRPVAVDLTTAPVRDGEQLVGAVLTFTDRRSFDALAARHAQLLSVLGDGLRGPLEQLRSELTSLASDPAGQLWPEANQVLHHLAAGYARMTTLVDNVLSYQRLDEGTDKLSVRQVSLDDVVTAGVEGATELIGPGRAQFAVHAPPVEAEVDPDRLAQALAHLVADVAGVDATGRATSGHGALGDSTIVVAAAQRGDVIRIEVRGPYAGGDPVHEPLVRGIVRQHGGVLQTHEVPGAAGGSAYVLEVPVRAGGGGPAVAPLRDTGGETTVMPVPTQPMRARGASTGPNATAAGGPAGANGSAALHPNRANAVADGSANGSADGTGRDGQEAPQGPPTGRRRRQSQPGEQVPRTPPAGTAAAPEPGPQAIPALPSATDSNSTGGGRRRRALAPVEEEHTPAAGNEIALPGQAPAEQPTGRRRRRGPAADETPAAGSPAGGVAAGGAVALGPAAPSPDRPPHGPVPQPHAAPQPAAAPRPVAGPALPEPAASEQPPHGQPDHDRAGHEHAAHGQPGPDRTGHAGQPEETGRQDDPASAPADQEAPAAPEEPPPAADRSVVAASPILDGSIPQPSLPRRPQPLPMPGSERNGREQRAGVSVRTLGQGFQRGPAPAPQPRPAAPVAQAPRPHAPQPPAPSVPQAAHPQAPQPHAPQPAQPRPAAPQPAPGQVPPSPPQPQPPALQQGPQQHAPQPAAPATDPAPAAPVPAPASPPARRRKLAAPPEDDPRAAASTAASEGGRGREYAISAPAAGSAEGPEHLDGPNGAVEVTEGRGLPVPPPADDELPPEPLDNPRRLLVWPEPDVSTQQALTDRGYRPVLVHSREEVDAQIAAYPAALFVDPLTGPITRTALQSLRAAAVAAEVPVLVTAGLGQATREAAYGADPAVLLKALAPRDSEQHPPRVLLVEERQAIADALTVSLERRGMQVAHAVSDTEAMEVASQVRPNLVVMDLHQVRRRRAGMIDWLRVNGLLSRTPFVVYTSAGMDPAQLPQLASGETVLFLAERSTHPEVQERIVDLLAKIGAR
ncbi:hypothetical protein GCM10009716_40080 [Streptomyces sodiiphilus]|uniref:PAS domain S-box protein n=1 Tax=Streptomyces sodiiphilus TaxID=226217 RepID=A0ABP5B2C4_9ACTN